MMSATSKVNGVSNEDEIKDCKEKYKIKIPQTFVRFFLFYTKMSCFSMVDIH